MAAAKKTTKPMAAAVNTGRSVVPDISSVATKQALIFTTKEAGKAISELVDACNKAGAVTGEQDIDEAFEMLSQVTLAALRCVRRMMLTFLLAADCRRA